MTDKKPYEQMIDDAAEQRYLGRANATARACFIVGAHFVLANPPEKWVKLLEALEYAKSVISSEYSARVFDVNFHVINEALAEFKSDSAGEK